MRRKELRAGPRPCKRNPVEEEEDQEVYGKRCLKACPAKGRGVCRICGEKEGAQDGEESNVKLSVRLGSCGAACLGCTAEAELLGAGIPGTSQRGICLVARDAVVGARKRKMFMCELLAVGISGTPVRTCLLVLDASEARLCVPSHCIASLQLIFPIQSPVPQYIWTSTVLLGCVRQGKESTPHSVLLFSSQFFLSSSSSPQIE